MRRISTLAIIAAVAQITADAQVTRQKVSPSEPRFEFGGGGGGSFYQSKTLTSAAGSADAGFDTGFAGAVWLGQNMYPKIGGELRYEYAKNDLHLKGGGTTVNFSGYTHAIHYDILYHATPTGSKVRPYVFAGGGLKMFAGTGKETAFQGFNRIAVLSNTTEYGTLLSVGGGIKFAISKRVQLRAEFRDNITPFPSKVITPVNGAKGNGWVQNFLPLFGITYLF